jgi:hypothetical protein
MRRRMRPMRRLRMRLARLRRLRWLRLLLVVGTLPGLLNDRRFRTRLTDVSLHARIFMAGSTSIEPANCVLLDAAHFAAVRNDTRCSRAQGGWPT